MNLIIHNAGIFTNDDKNTFLENQAVAIEGNRILEVGPEEQLKEKYARFRPHNGRGGLLMPGLVNVHMHLYSTFARGIAFSARPVDFAEILSTLWWKLDSALDSEAVYYSALVAAITAIKCGVTAIIDHHASPNAIDGSLDRIEEALTRPGLRGVLCCETSDRHGQYISQQSLHENERYIQKCQSTKEKNPNHLLDAMIGLHASFTLENDTLELAADLSRSTGRGCHIHLAEDAVDRLNTADKFQGGLAERLQQFGILGEQTIAAHCIHLTEAEKDLLGQTDTMIAHTPQSNMNNAVGRTDIFGYLERGMLTGIGTDGMSADIKPDVRTANLLHKHDLKDYNLGWNELQKMTLKNNPAIWERVTAQKTGRIESGYLADLILIDYFPPTPINAENFWGHFLYGLTDAAVDTSIINGRIVLDNRRIVDLDEEKIAFEARRVAGRVWKKFHDR